MLPVLSEGVEVAAVGLTKRECDGAEPRAAEYSVWDGDLAGFGLRVWPSGKKTFAVKYRVNGRQRKLTLGTYGALTVDEARKLARAALADVAGGSDPATEKASRRTEMTVRELCARFDADCITDRLKPKTARPYRRLIADRIVSAFGSRKLSSVTRADVVRWHGDLRATPVEANRALLLLHKLYNMAALWEWYEGPNPAHGVPKFRETARKRWLTGAELYRIGLAIAELEQAAEQPLSKYTALALKLLMLTGCRKDEVLTLKWSDVDLDHGVLNLADSKTGSKTVVLGAPAAELLRLAPRESGSPWVVTGRRRDASGAWPHVANPQTAWEQVKRTASEHRDDLPDVDVSDVHVHDLRHGFASIGVVAGLSLPFVGALLGHADQASTHRYAHLNVDPLRVAADIISNEIAARMEGREPAPVVGIAEGRRG